MHGFRITDEVKAAVDRFEPNIRVLEFPEEAIFGDILAALSDRAEGRLIAKIDDDDYYGQDHVFDLVTGWRGTGSALVGKAAEFIYLAGEDVTLRRVPSGRPRMSSWLAGGAMMVSGEAFRAAGGWRPVRRHVDQALISDVLRIGESTYRLPGYGYMLERHGSHTWDRADARFALEADSRWDGWRGDLADVEPRS